MNLSCPACGATYPAEAAVADADARAAFAKALALRLPADLVISYLGLFRPARKALAWKKATRLLAELAELAESGVVRRRGREWQLAPGMLEEALRATVEAKPGLTLPLKDSSYLLEVLARISNRAEGEAERAAEDERRRAAKARGGGGGPAHLSASTPISREVAEAELAKMRRALGRNPE